MGNDAASANEKRAYSDEYSTVRGFNYQPSYGATGLEIWRNFKPDIVEKELGLGKKYFPGMNTVRAWLSFDAFVADHVSFEEAFEQYLTIADRHGIRVVPTLFNNWHSIPDFGGVAEEIVRAWFKGRSLAGAAEPRIFLSYLERIVAEHAEDQRVLIWDLCNEPFNSGAPDLFLEWLTYLYRLCKTLGATQPIGISDGATVEEVQAVEAISDVLLPHLYFAAEEPNAEIVAEFRRKGFIPPEPIGKLVEFAAAKGKPILCTECCWGSLDDAERGRIVASELDTLSGYNIGFLAHALHESLVADLHRPQYGPVSRAGYMAFINMDGSLRKHHDIFNRY